MGSSQSIVIRIAGQLDGSLNAAVAGASKALGQLTGSSGNTATRMGTALMTVGSTLTKTVTVPLVGAAAASIKAASDYEAGLAKVTSIVNATGQETGSVMSSMRNDILKLSNDTGMATSDITDATYQAISASVPAANAVQFVGDAAKLAKAGLTDTATATDTLTTAINAYGYKATDAMAISDKLLTVQNLGKTTIDELGSSIGSVIPTAAMYGTSLDQLSAGYIALTKNGVNTAQSTTMLNSMISELGKSGTGAADLLKAKTGKSFADLMSEGKSLTDVLGVLDAAAKAQGKSLGDVFSNKNAVKGAAVLSQHAADFNNGLTEIQKNAANAGAVTNKAVQDINANDPTHNVQMLKNSMVNLGTAIGENLLPILTPTIDKITSLVQKFGAAVNGMTPAQKDLALKFAGIAIAAGPVLTIFGRLLKFGGTIGSVFGSFGKAASAAAPASKAFGKAASGMASGAKGFIAAGAGIALAAVGIGLLAQSAIAIAQAGPAAGIALAAMAAGMMGMMAIAAQIGPSLTAGAAGFVAFGAGIALAAAGCWVLSQAAIQIAAAGPAAGIAMAAMAAGVVALGAGAGALAPLMIAGAVAVAAMGVALGIVSAAALLGGAALMVINAVLPAIVASSSAGSAAIMALGAAMMTFGVSCAAAGAGALIAGVGFIAMAAGATVGAAAMILLAAGAVAANVGMLPLAAAITAVAAAVAIIGSSAKTAGTSLASIATGAVTTAAKMAVIAAGCAPLASALAPLAASAAMTAAAMTALGASGALTAASFLAATVAIFAFTGALMTSSAAITTFSATAGMISAVAPTLVSSFTMISSAATPMASALMMMTGPLMTVSTTLFTFNSGVMMATMSLTMFNAGTVAVNTALMTMVATATSAMASFTAAIRSGGAAAIASCHSTANGMVAAFSGLSGRMHAAGVSAMNGLRAGIASAGAAAIAQARSIAARVASTVNSALKIHSPSRVLAESGQYAGQGLAVGLKDSAPAVAQASANYLAQPVADNAVANTQGMAQMPKAQGRRAGGYRSGLIGSTIEQITNKQGDTVSTNNNTTAPVITFSPHITIQGNASEGDVRNALKMSQREFEKMMKEYLRGKGRVSFA